MRRLTFTLLFLLFSSTLILADKPSLDEWKSVVESDGVRKVKILGHGMTPEGIYQTMLMLQCKPGNDGLITFLYLISGANEIKQFAWKDYEGSDAPASKKKLGQIRVFATTGNVTVQKELKGYFANPEAFAF